MADVPADGKATEGISAEYACLRWRRDAPSSRFASSSVFGAAAGEGDAAEPLAPARLAFKAAQLVLMPAKRPAARSSSG